LKIDLRSRVVELAVEVLFNDASSAVLDVLETLTFELFEDMARNRKTQL